MKIRNNVDIHNNFNIKLVNRSGDVTDKGYAENVVLDNFWYELSRTSGTSNRAYPDQVGIGSGILTEDIDISATSMANKLGANIQGVDKEVTRELVNNIETTTIRFEVTIPATSEYVGEITEVATFNSSSMLSHALLKDSEGNPISITKTKNDAMIINVTFYVVVNFSSDITPSRSMSLIANIISRSRGINHPSGMDNAELGLSTMNHNNFLQRASSTTVGFIDSRTRDSSSPKELLFNKKRLADTRGNLGFANYINIRDIGSVQLPNANYFPEYEIKDLDVATGDGVRNVYTCPIPEFIDGSEVVKIDGIPLEREVDYQIDSSGNGIPEHLPSISKSAKTPHFLVGADPSGYPTFYNVTSARADRSSYLEFIEPVSFKGICFMDLSDNRNIEVYAKNSLSDDWTLIKEFTGDPSKLVDWRDLETDTKYKYWALDGSSYSFRTKNPNMPIWFGDKPSEGIRFTKPPAENSRITISCKVDRPFKSKDFIFDTSYKFNY